MDEPTDNTYWDTPRFIDGPSEAGKCTGGELGAITKWPPLQRTYENSKWYFIVFKPYNKPYLKDPEWYQHKAVDKARDWCRKKCHDYYVTREILATKTHSNALVVSSLDLLEKYHGKSCYNKYKMHVSELPNMGDRMRVLDYITKESKDRPYKLYADYYFTK